jgi:hypothetical protein
LVANELAGSRGCDDNRVELWRGFIVIVTARRLRKRAQRG